MNKFNLSIILFVVALFFSCKKDDSSESPVNCVEIAGKIQTMIDSIDDDFSEANCQELQDAVLAYRKGNCPDIVDFNEEIGDLEGFDIETLNCSEVTDCIKQIDELEAAQVSYSEMPTKEGCEKLKDLMQQYIDSECPNYESFITVIEQLDCSVF